MIKRIVFVLIIIEKQRKSLEFEHEHSEKMKNKLKDMLCWFIKREDQYKANLNNLEKRNKELDSILADMQHERDHTAFLNNAKVSELQNEINFLRAQIAQLRSNHEQQLMLQDDCHKDEISKYKHLLENTSTKSLPEQNVIRKNKFKNIKKHPALTNEETRKRHGKLHDKLPERGLEVDKVIRKRRKLFQDDKEVVDIV